MAGCYRQHPQHAGSVRAAVGRRSPPSEHVASPCTGRRPKRCCERAAHFAVAARAATFSPMSESGAARYPGTCRSRARSTHARRRSERAWRPASSRSSTGSRGSDRGSLKPTTGDYVIVRRDGLIAYHLAVGRRRCGPRRHDRSFAASICSTPPPAPRSPGRARVAVPAYFHLPVVFDAGGAKALEANNHARIEHAWTGAAAVQVLEYLGLHVPGSCGRVARRALGMGHRQLAQSTRCAEAQALRSRSWSSRRK